MKKVAQHCTCTFTFTGRLKIHRTARTFVHHATIVEIQIFTFTLLELNSPNDAVVRSSRIFENLPNKSSNVYMSVIGFKAVQNYLLMFRWVVCCSFGKGIELLSPTTTCTGPSLFFIIVLFYILFGTFFSFLFQPKIFRLFFLSFALAH